MTVIEKITISGEEEGEKELYSLLLELDWMLIKKLKLE
jgi:hypothetical protein